jgi:hypothetical protein
VDDARAVRPLERVGDLDAEPQDLLERQRPRVEAIRERAPFEELHDEVVDAVLVPDVVKRADVRMGQGRDGLRLALEARPRVGILRKMRGKDLDRDETVEPRVARAIHLAHAPGSERGDDLVRTEARARGQAHSISLREF